MSEELVALALFDDDVATDIKQEMANAMLLTGPADKQDDPPKRATVDLQVLQGKSLANFTTKHSRMLLKNLKWPDGCLQSPATQWGENADFQTANAFASTLAATNVNAERETVLVQEFCGLLTKDKMQLHMFKLLLAAGYPYQ